MLPFPYSPFAAAQHLFGYNDPKLLKDAKKTEFVKFMDICEHFFISHPASGQKEGLELERVMLFLPASETLTKQMEITGMAEAIVNFSANILFNQPKDTEIKDGKQQTKPLCINGDDESVDFRYISSSTSKEVVLVVENGAFFIGVSLNRKLCKQFDYCVHLPTIRALLERAYNAYKLFYGSFSVVFNADLVHFKNVLDSFFAPYLQLLRVCKTPLVDLFSGVDFLPLGSLNFLEVHCLMTNCLEEFPQIKKTIFLYQERLIQYSVEKRDLIVLWHFLTQTIVPSAMQAELTPEGILNEKSTANTSTSDSNKSGFFVDSSIIRDYLGEFSDHKFPKIFILDGENDDKCVEYYLIAYRVLNATACFFVRADETQNDSINNDFLENLSDFIDTKMSLIASTIGEQFSNEITARPNSNLDIPYHFIYFNPDSLSFRKSFAAPMVMSAENAVVNNAVQILPSSMHRLVYESYDKFISECSTTSSLISQLYIKADNDWWIVFKRMERRFLALFLPQQYSATTTIADIQECVDGIIQSRFPNLFIS
uniref:Uncharacterized protein n=1 Tax=Meloidogyne enterolobii TaxID=390850 RepID=A0A6V7UGI1_MELEN|nr:unnamed protein product [Meloidogyne enterolobii]